MKLIAALFFFCLAHTDALGMEKPRVLGIQLPDSFTLKTSYAEVGDKKGQVGQFSLVIDKSNEEAAERHKAIEKLINLSPMLSVRVASQQDKSVIVISETRYINLAELMKVADYLGDEQNLLKIIQSYDSPYALAFLLQGAEALGFNTVSLIAMDVLVKMLVRGGANQRWFLQRPEYQFVKLEKFLSWFERKIRNTSLDQKFKSIINNLLNNLIVNQVPLAEKAIETAVFVGGSTLISAHGRDVKISNFETKTTNSLKVIGSVQSLSVGNNNELLVIGTEKELVLYDLQSKKVLKKIGIKTLQVRVAVHPSQRLVAVSEGNSLYLYENSFKTKKELGNLPAYIDVLAFSCNGSYLAAAGKSKTLFLADLISHKNSRQLVIDQNPSSLIFSCEQENLLFIGTQKGTIITAELGGFRSDEYLIQQSPIIEMAFRPMTNQLASGSMSKEIALYDYTNKKILFKCKVSGEPRAVRFTADAKKIDIIDSNGIWNRLYVEDIEYIAGLSLKEKVLLTSWLEKSSAMRKNDKTQNFYLQNRNFISKLPENLQKRVSRFAQFDSPTEGRQHSASQTKNFWQRVYSWLTGK